MSSRVLSSRLFSRVRSKISTAMRLPALRMQNMLEIARKEDQKAISEKRDISPVPYVAAAAAAAPIVTGFPAQVLAVTPPLFYFYLQTSGIATCSKIKEAGTTGDFSPAQFVSLYTNGTVWVIYGALAQDMTVLIPNATAVGFGLYYTSVFAKYHPESMMKWYAGSAAIIAGSAAAATLPNGLDIVGWTGCAMAVILLSSPLAVVGKVMKDKSTAALPFGPSLAGFLNASTWAAYGSLVAMDPYIYAPNGLGMAACAIQLSLFGIYGFPPSASAEAAKPVEEAAEPEKPEEKPKA